MALLNFNAKDHDDFEANSAWPEGNWIVRIVNSSMEQCKATAKDPNGQYLKLELVADKGQKVANRKHFMNLNLINKSETAVELAQRQLASICRACGKPGNVRDSQELHGIPFMIHMVVKPDDRGKDYPDQNSITAFKAVEGVGGGAKFDDDGAARDEAQEAENETPGESVKKMWDD